MSIPKPRITPVTRHFWDGLRNERIELQRCNDCENLIYYPRMNCPFCAGHDLEWHEIPGKASLYSYSIADVPVSQDFADLEPQVLAIAELDEGVRMATTLIHVAPDQIRIGMPIEPVFDHNTFEDITLLRFRPGQKE